MITLKEAHDSFNNKKSHKLKYKSQTRNHNWQITKFRSIFFSSKFKWVFNEHWIKTTNISLANHSNNIKKTQNSLELQYSQRNWIDVMPMCKIDIKYTTERKHSVQCWYNDIDRENNNYCTTIHVINYVATLNWFTTRTLFSIYNYLERKKNNCTVSQHLLLFFFLYSVKTPLLLSVK